MKKDMRLSEMRECIGCGEGVMKNGKYLHWYAIEVGQFVPDHQAINRAVGLETFFQGNVALARAMGVDEVIGRSIEEPLRVPVCFDCYLHKTLVELHEAVHAQRDHEREREAEVADAGA